MSEWTKERIERMRMNILSDDEVDPFTSKMILEMVNEIERAHKEISELYDAIHDIDNERVHQKYVIENLQSALEQEREAHRWIPVSERLPEVPDGYIVEVIAINMNGDKKPFLVGYDNRMGFETLIVTHWVDLSKYIDGRLPLPEPPDVS